MYFFVVMKVPYRLMFDRFKMLSILKAKCQFPQNNTIDFLIIFYVYLLTFLLVVGGAGAVYLSSSSSSITRPAGRGTCCRGSTL